MISVKIELKETSQKIELEAEKHLYERPLFCVYTVEKKVHKFPLANIQRITEDYKSMSKDAEDAMVRLRSKIA